MSQEKDPLTKAIDKLSQYDEWQDIVDWVHDLRESKFSLLGGEQERVDAKLIGAMGEDAYILSVLKRD